MTTTYADLEVGCRVEILVEFVTRRSIEVGDRRIHRLLVVDRSGESFSMMIAPGRDALFDLKTGESYTIRGLLVCDPREPPTRPCTTSTSDARPGPVGRRGPVDRDGAVDPVIRRGASRFEIDRPFGVVDDRSVVSVGTGERDRFPNTGSPSNGRSDRGRDPVQNPAGPTPDRDTDVEGFDDPPGCDETTQDPDRSEKRTTTDDDWEIARSRKVLSQSTADDTEHSRMCGVSDSGSADPSDDLATDPSIDRTIDPSTDQRTGLSGDRTIDRSSDDPTDRRRSDGGRVDSGRVDGVVSSSSHHLHESGAADDVTLDELYETVCDPPLVPRLHGDAIVELSRLASTHPIGPRFVEPLVIALERQALDVDGCALGCLLRIAREHPERVLEHAEVVTSYVTVDGGTRTDTALDCCLELVRVDPVPFLDVLPTLDLLLLADSTASTHSIGELLSILASSHPFAVKPIVPRLLDAAVDADEKCCTAALTAVERVTAVDPSATVEYVDRIADVTASRVGQPRATALRVLTEVGRLHPEDVLSQLSVVLDALSGGSAAVRIEAAELCAELARAVPDGMDVAVTPVIDRLDDPVVIVRRNACEALGCLAPPEAADALRIRRDADTDERTRDLVEWALHRIERADQ